jgi:hypothetical protein
MVSSFDFVTSPTKEKIFKSIIEVVADPLEWIEPEELWSELCLDFCFGWVVVVVAEAFFLPLDLPLSCGSKINDQHNTQS